MKTATLNRSTEPTTASVGAATTAVAQPGLGSPPDDVLRGGEINRLADVTGSIRKASVTAGVGLLLMSVLSAVGYLVAVKGLAVPGNAALTAKNIADHEGLLRFGILSLYLVVALDVVVAWALYRVFKPVSEAMSKLAAWLRVAYAGVFIVAISQLVGALRMPTQALQRINTFTNIWDAGLVLFGLNLFVLGYPAYRSGYVPRLLGVLLAIAGFGYVFDTVVRVLARGSSSDVSAITGMGEFAFAGWLVIRGRRIALCDSIGAAR
jgi:Domain of unknown function (DUF4386)